MNLCQACDFITSIEPTCIRIQCELDWLTICRFGYHGSQTIAFAWPLTIWHWLCNAILPDLKTSEKQGQKQKEYNRFLHAHHTLKTFGLWQNQHARGYTMIIIIKRVAPNVITFTYLLIFEELTNLIGRVDWAVSSYIVFFFFSSPQQFQILLKLGFCSLT